MSPSAGVTLGGTSLSVTPAATFASTLRVGTVGTSQAISRFTSSAIKSMAAQELAETVPTSQAVKDFVNWAVPPGTVMAYASETAPEGWLECDGRSLDGAVGSTYRNLFVAIGKNFGSGNGSATGFNLPDLRGRFVRGWNHTSTNDPDAASRWNTSGGNPGNRVGSYQDDQTRTHTHGFTASGTVSYLSQSHDHWIAAFDSWTHSPESQPPPAGTPVIRYDSGSRYLWFGRRTYTDLAYTSHNHTVSFPAQSTSATGGNESRPKNASLMYIIKY